MAQSKVAAFRGKDLRERESLIQNLRRRFERVSRRRDGRPWIARAGRMALILYWGVCLAVIAVGLNAWRPEIGQRLAYALRDPAMDLTAPFPNCSAAHAAGYSDIPVGSPAYTERQDGDGDGLACEPYPHTGAGERLSKIWRRWRG